MVWRGREAGPRRHPARPSGPLVRRSILLLAAVSGSLGVATAVAATTTTTVRSNNSPRYGRILANSSGHTLYYWCAGTSSTCTSSHSASSWPPLIAQGRLTAAAHSGVNVHQLG